jgi:spoIIIJ-associated protein
MSTKRRFFSGSSLDQALLSAASHYKAEPAQIAYREREKKHGVAKSRRAVVIEVDPDNPLRTPGTATGGTAPLRAAARPDRPRETAAEPSAAPAKADSAPAKPSSAPARESAPPARPSLEDAMVTLSGAPVEPPRRPAVSDAPAEPVRSTPAAEPRQQEEDDDGDSQGSRRRGGRGGRGRRRGGSRGAGEAENRLPLSDASVLAAARESTELQVALAGLELDVKVVAGDERLEIELAGEDEEDATAEDGEVLEAIEYLAPRMMHGRIGFLVHCRVDCDGFRAEREEELTTLALEAAEAVRSSGRTRTLEPMNPADRRLVHMTLADAKGVVTESVGDGFFKRVTVLPS